MRPLLLLVVLATAAAAAAQVDEGVLPLDDPIQRFLQRQQTAGALDGALLTTLPLSAYEARTLLDSLAVRVDSGGVRLSTTDRKLLRRFRGEDAGPNAQLARRFLGDGVYANGESLLAVDGDGYTLRVNPIAYGDIGRGRLTGDGSQIFYSGIYGAQAAGRIGNVFFDAQVSENVFRPPTFEFENNTVPRVGFTRTAIDGGTYGYFDTRGVVGYKSKYLELRAGRERAHWGFGEGSVELSDFAAPQDHVEIRARFWRVRYTNRAFRRVRPVEREAGALRPYPLSFTALHQLALDLPGGIQLEAFEMVNFSEDSLGTSRDGFELAYLNPVVAYTAVEGDLGAFDNVIIGAGAAWNAAPGYRMYGQFVLDERRSDRLFEDWWGTKWGLIGGLHVVDPGWGDARLRGVSARVEYARQRPYLYSHRTESSAYVHLNDTLGHPAGPNSSDLTGWLTLTPTHWATVEAIGSLTVRGRNTATENFGSDPTITYDTRVSDFGVETLQGVRQRELNAEAWLAVEILPQMTLGLGMQYRSIDDAELGVERSLAAFAQGRWGLPFRSSRY